MQATSSRLVFLVGSVFALSGLLGTRAAENQSPHRPESTHLNTRSASHVEVVTRHGAIGDGTTDDTAGIQSAVNALPRSGGAVFFPLGTYLISSNIKTGARPVIFRGQGRASILKARGTSLTAILEMNHASAAGSRVSLLTFHGSKTGGTGEIQRGVYAHGAANCVVSECTFSGPTADVVTGLNFGVDLYRAHGSRVVDCRFERMVSSGGNGTSVLIEMTDNCEVRGCSIDGSKFNRRDGTAGAAIQITSSTSEGASNNRILGNTIRAHPQVAVDIGSSTKKRMVGPDGSTLAACRYNVIEQNDIRGSTHASGGDASSGIVIVGNSHYNRIANNRVFQNGHAKAGGYGISIVGNSIVVPEAPRANEVVGNSIYENQDHGLWIQGAVETVVQGNVFRDNGARTANAFCHIKIVPVAKGVDGRGTRINANVFSGTQLRYHIEVEATVADTIIGTNLYGAVTTSPIETNASTTILELTGSGVPRFSAAPGSRYYRTDGAAGATLYIKETGYGSSGWAAK